MFLDHFGLSLAQCDVYVASVEAAAAIAAFSCCRRRRRAAEPPPQQYYYTKGYSDSSRLPTKAARRRRTAAMSDPKAAAAAARRRRWRRELKPIYKCGRCGKPLQFLNLNLWIDRSNQDRQCLFRLRPLKVRLLSYTLLQCEKEKIFSFCLLSGNVKSLAQSPLFQCSRVKQKAPCLGRSLRNLGPLGLTWSFLLGAAQPPPALKPTAAAVSGMTGMSSGSRSADASQLQSTLEKIFSNSLSRKFGIPAVHPRQL